MQHYVWVIHNMNLKGTITETNLINAFIRESIAKNKYEIFANKAKQEGYEVIYDTFMKIADNEHEHSKIFSGYLDNTTKEISLTYINKKINTTSDSLEDAMKSESEESDTLYPIFADVATKEGFPLIADKFRYISKIENSHRDTFKKTLESLKNNSLFTSNTIVTWECRACGHTYQSKEALGKCIVCEHSVAYQQIK